MMKPLTLAKIAETTGGTFVGDPNLRARTIQSVARDHREVKDGSLFLCIRGTRADGHDYAGAAFENGAVCALAERELDVSDARPYILVRSTTDALRALGAYYRSLFDIPIIGVTGSVGKTTAKEMLAAALGARFNVLKTEGNLNNELGVPLTLLRLGAEHTAAVIEMGISGFGEMSRLAEMVRPTVCVMTLIGSAHLETLGGLDGVLRAKSEVFAHMPKDGVAVVCGDDERLWELEPGVRKITFGMNARNDFRAENFTADSPESTDCDIVSAAGRFRAVIPAYGAHMILAALPAAAVGTLLGMRGDELARGIRAYTPAPGRAELADTGYLRLIDDCYNANPHSMRAALESLRTLPGRRVAILGDMRELGARSGELHREIGALAAETGVDCLVTCGERAEFIFKGWIAARGEAEAYHFPFRDALLERLPSLVRRADNVLVKASHSMDFAEIAARLRTLR
ncbi:MAG: UDP-N-acetylmuramoyl-tripeptide--D-alanyl-D-alanine ligase [Oscillospiraceae bacterium]|jgi:UDP-N-acetylmuramoyl-tripeptide--D-alanyl-D-alanine ligase|nr:UDP-N-acetylmuramoyl-tripeptide--D-alanyl-D-alanine ligase [Oscillospiraceae bacterium]